MKLNINPLKDAVNQLEEAIDIHDSESDPRLKRHLRAAVIQAFEFTYELSFKMIRRYLEMVSVSPAEVDKLSFNNLIRQALAQDLVRSDILKWRDYRKYRGITSHTYDEKKAQMVFQYAPSFLEEVKHLVYQLQKKGESHDAAT